MIDKKAYDMLVSNYADELLKEAGIGIGAKKVWGAVKKVPGAVKKVPGAVKKAPGAVKKAPGAAKAKYDAHYTKAARKRIEKAGRKATKSYNEFSSAWQRSADNTEKLRGRYNAAQAKVNKMNNNPARTERLLKIRDGATIAGGTIAVGGTGKALYNHFNKSASEMVAEIMEKRASQQYAYNEEIAKSAAELLVEAVMYKQAAYDQMENAQACFDAGQVALDSIGYEL